MMPVKVDKPTQNSALQGILEQENFMIKVFSSATAESVLLSEMPENQGIVGLWKWLVSPLFYMGF